MKIINNKNKYFTQNGNALITLVFFTVIAVTVITSTALVLSANMLSTNSVEQGTASYYAAESGVENGMLDVLRNPPITITGGPTMPVGKGYVKTDIIPDPTDPAGKIIKSTGTTGTSTRTIEVKTTRNVNGVITVTSWKEVANP